MTYFRLPLVKPFSHRFPCIKHIRTLLLPCIRKSCGEEDWNIGSRPGRITAGIVDNVLQVDFQKPVGNAQIIVSRDNGQVVKQHDEIDPQQVVMDLNDVPAGQYLLEIYTDTEAVGGVFRVK